jgi:L-aminopeptidase/D-esterase-like protein
MGGQPWLELELHGRPRGSSPEREESGEGKVRGAGGAVAGRRKGGRGAIRRVWKRGLGPSVAALCGALFVTALGEEESRKKKREKRKEEGKERKRKRKGKMEKNSKLGNF